VAAIVIGSVACRISPQTKKMRFRQSRRGESGQAHGREQPKGPWYQFPAASVAESTKSATTPGNKANAIQIHVECE
jgi:hypothetical protein